MSSATPTVELVLHPRNLTGESPVWHAAEQALYWVDIPAGTLHRWRAADGQHTSWQAAQRLACLALMADGHWLGAMEDGVYRLSPQADQQLGMAPFIGVRHERAGMRFNDGRCDRQGRFWVGSMLDDGGPAAAVGVLYRLAVDAGVPRLDAFEQGMLTPNGLAFSPDGRTMYLSDSHPERQRVWAFDYDPDDGVPRDRRLFIEKLPGGRPDGAAIDADGCYWICGNDAGLIHRYTPDGRLDRSLSVPVAKPSMCAFGGRDLDTLFVTSIRPAGAGPLALDGGLFALQPGVQGCPEPVFSA